MRRADGLTIRRLSWSLQLRHVETLAHDLPAQEWKKQRDEVYDFAHNHVLRADTIFSQYTYLPRLLGFAISLKDWYQADAIVRKSLNAFDLLAEYAKSKMLINGTECVVNPDIWLYAKGSLTWAFIDAAARCYPIDLLNKNELDKKIHKLEKVFLSQLLEELTTVEDVLKFKFDCEEFHNKAPLLAWADLAKIPYKKLSKDLNKNLTTYSDKQKKRELKIAGVFKNSELLSYQDLEAFLNDSQDVRLGESKESKDRYEPIIPFLFPTRPYSPEEITELVPKCIGFGRKPLLLWASYVRAVRGVWVSPVLLEAEIEDKKEKSRRTITVGSEKSKKVMVAITNLATEDDCWAASVCNKPALSFDRYKRLSDLINQAIKLKPKYLLLPELSLPLRWVNSISNRLQNSGINLIAGTEYRHFGNDDIYSEALLM